MPPPCVGCTGAEESIEPLLIAMPNNSTLPVPSSGSDAPSSLRSTSPDPLLLPPLSPEFTTEKPNSGSKIVDLVGRKSTKELLPGESCLLFMKLYVPRIRASESTHTGDINQESLFAELQSMVGTLEQDILHVETRYKHSLVPETNTLTCRMACKIRRPKTDSRWSICSANDVPPSGPNVHERLAKYISSHCPPQQALDLIRHHLGRTASAKHPIDSLCSTLEAEVEAHRSLSLDTTDKPSILISDTSLEAKCSIASPTPSDHFSTAPCSPLSDTVATAQTSMRSRGSLLSATPAKIPKRKSSAPAPPAYLPISVAKTTTALSSSHPKEPTPESPPGPDNARALWKHIRQSSLSTMQQLAEAAPETLEQLEANDEVAKELRKKALANKRSVGPETLRTWRWDGSRGASRVAPWM